MEQRHPYSPCGSPPATPDSNVVYFVRAPSLPREDTLVKLV